MYVVSPIISSVQRMPPVTENDADLIRMYIDGDVDAGNKLFRKHYRMILQVIGEVTRGRWYSDDCLQAGAFGLYKAAHKFDVSRGNKFLTMAVPWIRKYVIEEVRNDHLPAGGIAFSPKFKERLYRYIGFEITGYTDEEIMEKMRITSAELESLKTASKQATRPLYFSERDSGEDEWGDKEEDLVREPSTESLEDRFESDEGFRELRDSVLSAISNEEFDDQERHILVFTLGLHGEYKAVTEIAGDLHLSIPNFSEKRREALFKLRKAMQGQWDLNGRI